LEKMVLLALMENKVFEVKLVLADNPVELVNKARMETKVQTEYLELEESLVPKDVLVPKDPRDRKVKQGQLDLEEILDYPAIQVHLACLDAREKSEKTGHKANLVIPVFAAFLEQMVSLASKADEVIRV